MRHKYWVGFLACLILALEVGDGILGASELVRLLGLTERLCFTEYSGGVTGDDS